MGATQNFGALLKRYTPEKVFENTLMKLSYIYANCDKDKSWAGGTYEIPLDEAGFSSSQYGSLAAANDIAEGEVALGTTTMKELWNSLLIREADLYRHGDMEQSYLKIVPDRIDRFVEWIKNNVSAEFLAGGRLAKATANGDVSGNITVDKVYLFQKGQKVTVDDANSSPVSGYIRTININTNVITLYDARTGGSAVDLSGYTTAQNAIVQVVGAASEQFTSLMAYTLPAANGGSDTIFGKTKTDYTVLQSLNDSGSGWTASSVLDDLYGAMYKFSEKRSGVFKEAWIDFGKMKNISNILENSRRYSVSDKKAGFGWASVNILGPEGETKIVALREMPKEVVYFGDVKNIKFAGKEPFKRKMYDDKEYFMVRGSTGPEYIQDIALRGEFIVQPAQFAAVHSIPDSVSA